LKLLKKATLIGLLFMASRVNAQVDTTYSPSKTYSQSELLEDFTIFKNALIELHPSLYRYQSKATIDSVFEKTAGQINKSMTEIEFWRVLKPAIVSIHSGHTDLSFSSAEINWRNKYRQNYLPPIFHEQDGQIFTVEHKKSTNTSQVLNVKSIDGMPAAQILQTLKRYVSPEGMSDQFVNFQLQQYGFSNIYGEALGYKSIYKVIATDSLGVEKKITLNAGISRPANSADKLWQLLETKKDELNQVVSVDYPAGVKATAVLKIKNFTYDHYYLSFHEGFFKLMQQDNIENLVIDLRGNTGGNADIGLNLMRYLVNGTFAQIDREQIPETKITFNDYILKQSGDNLNLKSTDKVEQYKYRLRRFGDSYPVAENHFDKHVYVLIDKGTFSAASIFAASLKENRKITLVGEETGGAETGSDGGFCIVQLPHSKLLLRIPPYWENTVVKNPHSTHGLMPDVLVKQDIKDVGKGDKVMEKVKELILAEKR